MKLEQLICKKCGEYLAIRNTETKEIVVEEGVTTSFNDEMINCNHCNSAIALLDRR